MVSRTCAEEAAHTRLATDRLGGATQPEILRAYPHLQPDALEAAIRFAARSLQDGT